MSLTTSNVRTPGSSTDGIQLCPATNAVGGPAKLSAFGATPTTQPTPTGNAHTVTAGSTTAVYTNTTFDGGTGTSAYTIGDIVLALKNLGFLAS